MTNQGFGDRGSQENAVCCLCGQPLALSVAILLVVYAGLERLDESQELYAHSGCLKNHLAIDAPLISELNESSEPASTPIGPGIIEALAKYVKVLRESADATHQSENRPRYERHLAQAARMFEATRSDPSLRRLADLVADERRAFGWSFLPGDEGARVEREFDMFAKAVEEHREQPET